MQEKSTVPEMVADIVAAYVGNNAIEADALPDIIRNVHSALTEAETGAIASRPRSTPAATIKKSITPDYLICLEDGKKFKSLKRHLQSQYGMSPEEYRTKWGLPADYPMVAPNYAKARSELARKMGLGRKSKRRKRS
ncbi:MAG: MucR family transcriptional regulator [Pseudomonadota bacterium]